MWAKVTDPLTTGLSLFKTAWLVLFAPTRFFASYFTGAMPLAQLTFPLAALWRRISSKPLLALRPFQCLGIGLVLAAFTDIVWRWLYDLDPGNWKGTADWQEIRLWYQQQYGQQLKTLDLGHLTGFGLLDEPIYQVVQLLAYSYFALIVGWFLAGTEIRRNQYMRYHAYAVGTALVLKFIAYLAGFALFAILIGVSRTAAHAITDLVLILLGYLPMLWFIAVLPILVFPRVLSVSRARMLVATVCGLGLAGAFNWWFTNKTLFGMGLLIIY